MDNYHKGVNKARYSELNLLVAAGLISGFKQSSPEEIYGKAMKCFDVLMGILEGTDIAAKVSSIINVPVNIIIKTVQAAIDRLLFNPEKDPYMSLCLPRYASEHQVGIRWKRLIVFYHPDKYSDRNEYEERAKRINEAYKEIRKIREDIRVDETVKTIVKRNRDYSFLHGSAMKHLSQKRAPAWLRRLPTLVVIFSILLTIISVLLLIYAG